MGVTEYYKHLHEALWGCVMQSPAYILSSDMVGQKEAWCSLHLNRRINVEVWHNLCKAQWTGTQQPPGASPSIFEEVTACAPTSQLRWIFNRWGYYFPSIQRAALCKASNLRGCMHRHFARLVGRLTPPPWSHCAYPSWRSKPDHQWKCSRTAAAQLWHPSSVQCAQAGWLLHKHHGEEIT